MDHIDPNLAVAHAFPNSNSSVSPADIIGDFDVGSKPASADEVAIATQALIDAMEQNGGLFIHSNEQNKSAVLSNLSKSIQSVSGSGSHSITENDHVPGEQVPYHVNNASSHGSQHNSVEPIHPRVFKKCANLQRLIQDADVMELDLRQLYWRTVTDPRTLVTTMTGYARDNGSAILEPMTDMLELMMNDIRSFIYYFPNLDVNLWQDALTDGEIGPKDVKLRMDLVNTLFWQGKR